MYKFIFGFVTGSIATFFCEKYILSYMNEVESYNKKCENIKEVENADSDAINGGTVDKDRSTVDSSSLSDLLKSYGSESINNKIDKNTKEHYNLVNDDIKDNNLNDVETFDMTEVMPDVDFEDLDN